jgi:hypothetical protein
MSGSCKFNDNHILKSIRQVDERTWLIGNLVLQRLPDSSSKLAMWKDNDGSSFTLNVGPNPLPTATTDINSPYITLIHEAGNASAVWGIGNNVICKARYTQPGVTPESTTLRYVQQRNPSFTTPEVVYHAFNYDRNYLFLRRVSGTTLFKIWPRLDSGWRQNYINEIVRIIGDMGQWKGPIGGVDGQGLLENWLLVPKAKRDYTPGNLRANCEALGMNCSDCIFYHADLAPTNILVEDKPETGRVSLVDFELAGFFPKSWIRTKLKASWAFDLDEAANSDPKLYRKMMDQTLEAHGYDDLTEAWRQRRKEVHTH